MEMPQKLDASGHQRYKVFVRDGSRISFWLDDWSGNGRLRDSFPTLFTFARNKLCTVASHYSGQWNIQLHPNLSMTAPRQLDDLLAKLCNIQPDLTHGDKRVSSIHKGEATTAYFYNLLTFRGMNWPRAAFIWNGIIPMRH